MSDDSIILSKGKKKASTGSTQPLDGEFTKWIERQFRGGETPQYIDAYPLFRARDQEQRLYHYDVKNDEKISADRAVELSNEVYSDCQLHCDALPRSSLSKDGIKCYQVMVIDDRRGGKAAPVGSFLLRLSPRIHRPAPQEDDEDLSSEDSENLSARKFMIQAFDGVMNRDERRTENMIGLAGDTMLLQKSSLVDREDLIKSLFSKNMEMIDKFLQLATLISERRVEERAVAIDAENAAVDREYRRAQLAKETMWTDVTRAGLLEGIGILKNLFPSVGGLFMAMMQGKPLPNPPKPEQLAAQASGTALPANGQNGQTQLATVADEKKLIDSFITAAEQYKIDDSHTAEEKLFGKDDDAGKQIEPGVFRREQVAVLAGVRKGALPVEALDALLPDSGKPEAIEPAQLLRAAAFLTNAMRDDMNKFFKLRVDARAKKGNANA